MAGEALCLETQAHNGRSGASTQSIELLNTYHGTFDLRSHTFWFAFRVSFSLQCPQRVGFTVLDVNETTSFIAIDPSYVVSGTNQYSLGRQLRRKGG